MATNRGQALYPTLMGVDWSSLDIRLQSFHSGALPRRGAGVFQVRHGERKPARALARLLRMPRQGQNVPAQLLVLDGGVAAGETIAAEIWKRSFGDQELISLQYANSKGLLAERFGLIELLFRLKASDHSLVFVPEGAALALGRFRMRIPLPLGPRVRGCVSTSNEFPERFTVSINVTLPAVGLLIAYDGYIDPEVKN